MRDIFALWWAVVRLIAAMWWIAFVRAWYRSVARCESASLLGLSSSPLIGGVCRGFLRLHDLLHAVRVIPPLEPEIPAADEPNRPCGC